MRLVILSLLLLISCEKENIQQEQKYSIKATNYGICSFTLNVLGQGSYYITEKEYTLKLDNSLDPIYVEMESTRATINYLFLYYKDSLVYESHSETIGGRITLEYHKPE